MSLVTEWITGNLSSSARVWTALAPGLLLTAYFVAGLAVYLVRCSVKGPFRDPELENRNRTVLTGLWIRLFFAWVMQPVWRLLLRSGVPPNAVTTLSVLLATGSGVALAAGRFALGGWLYMFAGVCDFLDGRLARAGGMSSARGAALDSILDRYADAAVLMGLAWFYRDTWVLLPVLLAIVGSSLVPYIRAKGEAVGINVTVGLMQRAERILYLGAAVALSPIVEVALNPNDPRPIHRLAVAGVVLLAISTQLTALHRLFFVLSALDEPLETPADAENKSALMRNVLSAAVATGVDFLLVAALVAGSTCSAPAATAVGCVIGAVVNFSINRMWTFSSRGAKLPQIWRYSFVSITSALLNSGGVAVFLLLPHVDYRIAWVLVRAAVFLAWNFPLHRDYVFVSATVTERLHVGHT